MTQVNDQLLIPFRIHQRTVLVTVETAKAALGLDAESIWAMIDCGEIRWAWNIATRVNGLREIRIWARELMQPGLELPASEVIDMLIGTSRPRLTSVEIARHVLCCSRPHMLDLLRSGELAGDMVGHHQFVHRASLAEFLTRRML
jgi:hypothetical protein